MARRAQGFTLIELLIAVLIVGILAAIALPALNGARDRAKDQEAKQALEYGLRAAKAVYAEGETLTGPDSTALAALLGRAERSTSFAAGTGFSPGQVSVERTSSSQVLLRSASRSGRNFLLAFAPEAASGGEVARLSAAGALVAQQNLVINPSFETSATSGWQNNNAQTSWVPTQDRSWSAQGSVSIRAVITTTDATSTRWPGIRSAARFAVSPSTSYSLQGRYKVNQYPSPTPGLRRLGLVLRFYDSGGVWLGSPTDIFQLGPNEATTGQWSFSGISPAAAVSAEVIVYTTSTVLSEVADIQVDGLSVTASTRVGRYFDGDSPAASWDGAAHASTSTSLGSEGW